MEGMEQWIESMQRPSFISFFQPSLVCHLSVRCVVQASDSWKLLQVAFIGTPTASQMRTLTAGRDGDLG